MARIKLQVLQILVSFIWTFNETYSTATNSTVLYFGLMQSMSGDDQSSGALAGVQAALDEINSRDDLLPGYSLNFTPTGSTWVIIIVSFRKRQIYFITCTV